MKTSNRFFLTAIVTIFVILASACAPAGSAPAAPVAPGGNSKSQASPVEFTGVIQAMDGNQWTINGQTVTVDSQAMSDAQFAVGDTVRVKGSVAPDGTVTASQVQAPDAGPSASTRSSSSGDASGSSGSNDNSSGDNSNGNSNDGQGDEDQKITGVVDAIDGNQITINGITYTVADGVDMSGIAVGDTVTVEVVTNADGTQTVTEIKSGDDSGDNSNGDNGNDNDSNDNDDNDNDDNDNDDDDNSNDDDPEDDDNDNGSGNSNDD